MSSIILTTENFQSEVLDSSIPVLVDFWAAWCGPCKMISPFLDEISVEYAGRLKVGKVNVDEQNTLAEQYGVISLPTLILYKEGAVVTRKSGAFPKHGIEALFKELV
jgi:thioredoxin 1